MFHNKSYLKQLIIIIFKYKKQHIFAFFFMVLNSVFIFLQPLIIMQIFDKAIKEKSGKLLVLYTISYVAVVVLQNVCMVISDYKYACIGKKIVFDLRKKLLKHLSKMNGQFYANYNAGDTYTTLLRDVAMLEDLCTKLVFSTISDILSSIAILAVLIYIQPDLLLIMLILQPSIFICQRLFSKKIKKMTNSFRNSFGLMASTVQEMLTKIQQVIIIRANPFLFSKFVKNSRDVIGQEIRVQFFESVTSGLAALLAAISFIVVLSYGGYKSIIGAISIGGLIAFIQYSQRILGPLMRISQLYVKMAEYSVSIDRIFDILTYKEPYSLKNKTKIENIKTIRINDVGFKYGRDLQWNMEGITLTFDKGKISALVGESGSGKTTVSNLLLRFWCIDKGDIFINGTSIKDINYLSLRKRIGIVTQDVTVFEDTIKNNILLKGTFSNYELTEVAKKVGLLEFIESLPNKFDTYIGAKGVQLSGGQRQKIAIARAIIRKPSVIILDEATSALDSISELQIKNIINDLARESIIIVITHRLSILDIADNIYVIKSGRLVESGTHKELLKIGGYYYNFYKKCESEEKEDIDGGNNSKRLG